MYRENHPVFVASLHQYQRDKDEYSDPVVRLHTSVPLDSLQTGELSRTHVQLEISGLWVLGILRSLDSPLASRTEPFLTARRFRMRKSLVDTSFKTCSYGFDVQPVTSQQPLSTVTPGIIRRETLGR